MNNYQVVPHEGRFEVRDAAGAPVILADQAAEAARWAARLAAQDRLARWLDALGPDAEAADELLGYALEVAFGREAVA